MREGGLLTSKGQVVVVWEKNHYRANDEAFHARGQLQRSSGFADGSGAVLVPQVEAFEKETADLHFTDTNLTLGIFSSVGVVWAVSLRADCGSDCGGS